MMALCVRRLGALAPLYLLAIVLILGTAGSRAVADERIVVHLDEARVVQLPDRATTLVIGNPLIADISVQPGGLAVVTGKSLGATNLIALDKSGAVLTEHDIDVDGPPGRTVVVYRGVAHETYSCVSECLSRIMLGDELQFFNNAVTQATTRNNQSLAAGAAAPH